MSPAPLDPALQRFRIAVAAAYGERLDQVVLFGSRARGEARPDSDYDIAVFIHGLDAWFDELVRLAEIGTDVLIETGVVISAKPFDSMDYDGTLALMSEIRRDGLVV